MMPEQVTYEVEIENMGDWIGRWRWTVVQRGDGYKIRMGRAMTKDRARRKALRAKRRMEVDDVTVVH
jgi:hypothetical protein